MQDVWTKGETVWHITSESEKLAQGGYKRRHDNVARIIHWELCGKYGIDRTKNWYEQKPIGVMENDKAKIQLELLPINLLIDYFPTIDYA